ncbi:MAG: hypothetical protein CSB01_01705 [Bacteroidia bacterium]|nr:MAG: hypothetical protein CSB01_01705 [Bacteroidia bacterium]
MNLAIEFNMQHYPIVSIFTTKDNLNDENVDIYLKQITDFYKRNIGKNIVVIYELSILRAVDAKSRIKIGKWLDENADLIKSAVKGVCYVQRNILQKIILQGIFVIKTPEWKHKVVRSLEEGVAWGRELLAEK